MNDAVTVCAELGTYASGAVIANVAVPEFSGKLLWQTVQLLLPGALVKPAGGPPVNARLMRFAGPSKMTRTQTAIAARRESGEVFIAITPGPCGRFRRK